MNTSPITPATARGLNLEPLTNAYGASELRKGGIEFGIVETTAGRELWRVRPQRPARGDAVKRPLGIGARKSGGGKI